MFQERQIYMPRSPAFAPAPDVPPRSPHVATPIETYLKSLHMSLSDVMAGEVASYIPELGLADPKKFGICIATVDGQLYSVGDAACPFTIQSMSKPFMHGYALREHGQERVARQVGVEPTGDPFNSITLDDVNNRPFNPMVNAGAIAVAELMKGENTSERTENMLDFFGQFAGRPLEIDEQVYRSEHATGHRNRAIAYMMLNTGMLSLPPEEVLETYFRQCAIRVTCRDMAVMAATLAAHGVNPRSGQRVLSPDHVRDVLSVMSTCGMYDYAGQWAFDVGLPAKSGVAGGVIAVIPGQLGIAVYSPPLDSVGNSIRGVAVCQKFAQDFSLHAYHDRTDIRSVIRREYTAGNVHSKRIRPARESAVLRAQGHRLVVFEVQGALFFGSTEKLIRRMAERSKEADVIVVDFKRAGFVDKAAIQLICQMARTLEPTRCRLVFTELGSFDALSDLHAAVDRERAETGVEIVPDTDRALEAYEEALLAEAGVSREEEKLSLGSLDLFEGLGTQELKLLESAVGTFRFDAGERIINEGDDAHLFFIVARGSVSISVTVEDGRSKRIGSVGPGYSFGEMALLDGEKRSADVTADVPVLCYGFSVARVREISAGYPNVMTVILGNIVRSISDRLRSANDEIRTLE
ncbi:MAG: glutaminase A [Confluentimicrobium sp.]|nr:glutaminase A [Actibacterium sp.]